MNKVRFLIVGSFFLLSLGACKKTEADSVVNIHLQSNDAQYYEVNAYIKEIWANHSTEKESSVWTNLPITAGYYNLLDLGTNDDALLLNAANIEPGQITQLRFVVDPQKSYLIEFGDPSLEHKPLPLANTQANGLKIGLNYELKSEIPMNIYLFWDINNGIWQDSTGAYFLNPIIELDTLTYTE